VEEGELEEGEGEGVDLRRAAWRCRALGLAFPGESLEALGEELQTLLGYCGRLDGQGGWAGAVHSARARLRPRCDLARPAATRPCCDPLAACLPLQASGATPWRG
jgi:hypothetical protein